MRKKQLVLFCQVALISLLGVGCSSNWTVIKDVNKLPVNVRDWVSSTKQLWVGATFTDSGNTYVLASWGAKTTSGYRVELVKPDLSRDEIIVNVKFTAPTATPTKGQPDYPFALARMKQASKSIRLVPSGDEDLLPALVGVPPQFRLFSAKDFIHYQNLATTHILLGSSGVVGNQATYLIEGVAQIFEATVEYDLLGQNGNSFGHNSITATSGAPDWGYFRLDIPKPDQPVTGIRVYSTSMKDGAIMDLVTVTP